MDEPVSWSTEAPWGGKLHGDVHVTCHSRCALCNCRRLACGRALLVGSLPFGGFTGAVIPLRYPTLLVV